MKVNDPGEMSKISHSIVQHPIFDSIRSILFLMYMNKLPADRQPPLIEYFYFLSHFLCNRP